MKKSKKGKQMKCVCYQCVRKKKNNEFKSEIAKIRLSIKKNKFQRQIKKRLIFCSKINLFHFLKYVLQAENVRKIFKIL